MTDTQSWSLVVVAAITAIPSTIAAIASLRSASQAKKNHVVAKRIEHQTNGQMDNKIREAVLTVFNEKQRDVTEAVMAESVRHLLNAMIGEDDR